VTFSLEDYRLSSNNEVYLDPIANGGEVGGRRSGDEDGHLELDTESGSEQEEREKGVHGGERHFYD
jgi:hypothetical protein